MHTIRSIADEHGVDKDVIRKRFERAKQKHGELGSIVEGTRQFTDDERAVLDSFAAEPRSRVSKPFEPTVDVGNHRKVIDAPAALESVSLERFRHVDIESVSFDNTDDVFSKINNGLSAIESAMDNDIASREGRLAHDKANQRRIQARVSQFQLKTLEYRLSAKLSDQMQTEATQQTSELIQLFQSLQEGKA